MPYGMVQNRNLTWQGNFSRSGADEGKAIASY
jgi:hypothetical protein